MTVKKASSKKSSPIGGSTGLLQDDEEAITLELIAPSVEETRRVLGDHVANDLLEERATYESLSETQVLELYLWGFTDPVPESRILDQYAQPLRRNIRSHLAELCRRGRVGMRRIKGERNYYLK